MTAMKVPEARDGHRVSCFAAVHSGAKGSLNAGDLHMACSLSMTASKPNTVRSRVCPF